MKKGKREEGEREREGQREGGGGAERGNKGRRGVVCKRDGKGGREEVRREKTG